SSVSSSLGKPLWLKDMYQPMDETQRMDKTAKLRDADFSEDSILNWANARSQMGPPPVEKRSSGRIEAAPPEEPLVKKASSKKLVPPPAAAEPPPSEEDTGGDAAAPKITDFTGNAISSIGKDVWRAYPWAEYLVLKGNRLNTLQNTSLDGLLSLTHLDVSCNKIKMIGKDAFEPVPFLQFINLSGNVIGQITQGTFQAWHGMQFLLKMILSHNPLTDIQDPHFYNLPSLKFLDLGATDISPKVVMDLLNTTIQLKMLVVPRKISSCLCCILDNTEVLSETIELNCTKTSDRSTTPCAQEESWNKMQDEVMKILGTRKQNRSVTLTILPENPQQDNSSLALTVTRGLSHFGIHFQNITPHLFATVQQLSKMKADEFLDVKWVDKSELQKLYMLAQLLQKALKEKIAEYKKESQGTEDQKEAPAQVSEQTEAPVVRVKRYQEEAKRKNWIEKIPTKEALFPGLGSEFPKAVMQEEAEQQGSLDLHRGAQSRGRKQAWAPEKQMVASLLRTQRAVFQSSWKRSILEAATGAPSLTTSIVVDKNAADDLTGKVVIILKHINKSKKLANKVLLPENIPDYSSNTQKRETSEDLGAGNKQVYQTLLKLHRLMHKVEESKMPADDTETLNDLSPDISLSQETHWEHREQQTPAPSQVTFLPFGEDYLLQGDLFEAELNQRLESLIPNVPVRNLISHVIRILKMDCMEPTIQMACTKLISRTGLLMKLFSEREKVKETSPLWSKMSMTRQEGKSDEISRQGIPEYGFRNKLLLALSVIVMIMVIIYVICLIEICSQKSRKGTSDKKRSFLGRRKKGKPEEQSSFDKPLWLTDIYQSLDETQRKSIADKLHCGDASENDIFNRANARPSMVLEAPPVEKRSSVKIEAAVVKKASSKTLTPEEPPLSDEGTGGEASVPKRTSLGEEGSEGTEGTAKKPSSEGEGEEEEEEED
ncbi:hypothetical protein JRQ81_008302, partial [Phrynocephalus forsythii]